MNLREALLKASAAGMRRITARADGGNYREWEKKILDFCDSPEAKGDRGIWEYGKSAAAWGVVKNQTKQDYYFFVI